jgi:hypothetical protein
MYVLMYLCMCKYECVNMYIYTHTHACIYVHTCKHTISVNIRVPGPCRTFPAYTHMHICTHMQTYHFSQYPGARSVHPKSVDPFRGVQDIHKYVCVYIYVYIYIYIHTHSLTHMHEYVCIYIYTHTCIYVHIPFQSISGCPVRPSRMR